MEGLAHDAGLRDPAFNIDGPAHSKWYHVDFGGMGTIGTTAAKQLFASLRDKDTNKWKETYAKGIALEGALPPDVQVFFNPDKSPRMEREAMLARKAKPVVEGLFPGKKVFIRRSDSRILVPCILPVANNADHAELKFKGPTFNETQRATIREAFSLKLGGRLGGEDWVYHLPAQFH